MKKFRASEVEWAVAKFFNYRQNLIVPNVSWGFSGLHYEADMVVLTKAGYAKEIEIKVDKYDLIKDKAKKHDHDCRKFKELYFAIPDYLMRDIEHIPERAGILKITKSLNTGNFWAAMVRPAKKNGADKLTQEERYELARLGTMRIWDLKLKLNQLEISPEFPPETGVEATNSN